MLGQRRAPGAAGTASHDTRLDDHATLRTEQPAAAERRPAAAEPGSATGRQASPAHLPAPGLVRGAKDLVDEGFRFAGAAVANAAQTNVHIIVAFAHSSTPAKSRIGRVQKTMLVSLRFRLRTARAPTDAPAGRQAMPMACRPDGGANFILP